MKTVYILVAAILMLPIPAMAFTSQAWDSVNVSSPVGDDFYGAGNRVSIQAPITGDLTVAGGDVSVSWNTSEGVIAAGGNLDISGKIWDDLRSAWGNVRVRSEITGDAVLAGWNIHFDSGAIVAKDLIITGGNVYVDGNVRGRTEIRAWKVYLNGTIDRDARIYAGEIVVGSNAQIRWNLLYESPKSNPDLERVTLGQKQFIQNEVTKQGTKGFFAIAASYVLWKILFLTVFGFLFLHFMGRSSTRSSEFLRTSPWTSLFTGLAFFVFLPILAVFLAITVIGIPFSLLFIMVFVFSFVFYELIGTVVWSSWALNRYMGGEREIWWKKLLVVLAAAFIFAIISGFDIILAWMAIGAILAWSWERWTGKGKSANK